MIDRPRVYSDEDSSFWIPVEDRPDRAVAAQEYADETGLIVRYEGRGHIRAQDCECRPPDKAVCPDDPAGGPCVAHEAIEVWAFEAFEASLAGEEDAALGVQAPEIWRPKGRWAWLPPAPVDPDAPEVIPVAPGQVEAGL